MKRAWPHIAFWTVYLLYRWYFLLVFVPHLDPAYALNNTLYLILLSAFFFYYLVYLVPRTHVLLVLLLYPCWFLLSNIYTEINLFFHTAMGKDFHEYFAWNRFGDLNKALYAGAGTLWSIFPPVVLKLLKVTRKNIQKQKDLLSENTRLAKQDTHAHLPPALVFNTLQRIHQQLSDNPAAQKATEQLTSLLDFAFYKSQQRNITIQEEIAFLESYIGFERMRHSPNRVTITFDHHVSSNISLPPLLFINFIENAFKHGINSTIRQSWVKIHLQEKEGALTFNVQNSLPEKAPPANGGIGLKNVRRRLELEFPGRFTLHTSKTNIFEIDLTIDLP